MLSHLAVGLFGRDGDLALLIHFHHHQCLFKSWYHLTHTQLHMKRLVVSGWIMQSGSHSLLFHRCVEDFTAWEASAIMDEDCVAFLSLETRCAHTFKLRPRLYPMELKL